MAAFTSVLCALDTSPLAPRVLRHAAGVAGVCGARLTVLTVTGSGDRHRVEGVVAALVREAVPAGAGYVQPRVSVVQLALGTPVDALLDHARDGIDLVVAGTHAKAGLARWLLGSTSEALLEDAVCPTMLVPPGLLEIVTLHPDRVDFHPGTVLAAVDLDEPNARQLALAAAVASLAGQPLTLMTSAPDRLSAAAAEQQLREHAARAGAGADLRVLVERGPAAEAIDRAAVAVHAGLVVMGLRERGHGTPGAIATAVLRTKDAVVLAVPAAPAPQ